jgi:hypothetical protein
MSLNIQDQSSDQIIRISLVWIFIGIVMMLLLGIIGGVLANQLWPTQRMPLVNEQEKIITTVQKVTISPNKAASEVVATANRSIIGITSKASVNKTLIATGIVVTNDGLVVTSSKLPSSELLAIDWQGLEVPLKLVGRDDFFGLTYLRIEEGILTPLDVRGEKIPIGNKLLVLNRVKETGLTRVDDYLVKEWVLPPELGPSGIQRLLKGTPIDNTVLTSGALIDEDIRLAGIVLNEEAGLILGGDHLLMSIQRVATNKREADPFGELGIKIHYALETSKNGERIFAAEIISIDPKSWATEKGLKVKDKIIAINDNNLNWEQSFADQITNDSLEQITVRRDAADVTIDIR